MMKTSELARKITRLSVASYFYVQLATVTVSEIFSQMYNPTKDLNLAGRLVLSFNPKLIAFDILFCVLAGFLIRAYLRPMWRAIGDDAGARDAKSIARARMIAVRLPWSLIVYNMSIWTIAVVIFYYANGKSMPSGLPFHWVMVIKLSEALIGSILNAFIIDAYLKEPKKLLHITDLGPRDVDRFIELKAIFIPFVSGLVIITHLAFVTWFYLEKPENYQGPGQPIFSILMIGALGLVLVYFLAYLSKKQDIIQFEMLNEQIRLLASSESSDLRKKVSILNFDETGRITASLNRYIESLHRLVAEVKGGCCNLKENDAQLTGSMRDAEESVAEINVASQRASGEITKEMEATGESLEAVREITERVRDLRGAVSRQNDSVSNSSAGIEEMIANIQAVAQNVERAGKACGDLLEAANRGKGKIEESNRLIGKVVESSTVLLGANKTIAAIASQTNLLAMNAAIEAAHAGDAGAGFAVVADEIRSLAEKSSAQSKSIAQQLKEVAAAIENAVGSSRQASVGFDEVLGLINAVTTMETENTMALREQRTGSDQVAETLAEMRETTESVNQVAASLSADSEQLERAIHRLSECSARAQSEMAEIARDIEKINGCFAQVAELKEKNSQTFGSVSEQVDRFIL
ncbi:MAG TPA: methyl-accepting chemotaxis protein [Treponemataceae bacterium]|jgi:methyl-accepting chemotaxis protein|nr:methyl-accepting chemotaxis protein [Treponemataceae bacterium]